MKNKSIKKPKRQPKVTLHPLSYQEAVTALLAVKPTKKQIKKK
jgi:hypothetical protein